MLEKRVNRVGAFRQFFPRKVLNLIVLSDTGVPWGEFEVGGGGTDRGLPKQTEETQGEGGSWIVTRRFLNVADNLF